MFAKRITGFGGMQPKVSPRMLPENGAQVAANCVLVSGELRPMFSPEIAANPAKAGPFRAIFKADTAWYAWDTDVDVARGMVGTEQRYYYTGDGEPRMTTESLAKTGGGENYPAAWRVLGVPKPITSPSVSPSGGVAVDVSRYYCYTFYDDLDQESAPSPLSGMTTGKPDGTWAISGMDAAPPNSGDITALVFTGKSVTITTTNTHFNRAGETITLDDVTTVTNVDGTWTLDSVNIAGKTMTFTVDETPVGTYNNATDTTDTWTRVAPFGTCTKRLYRTSGSVAQFQLVAEGIASATYNDTLSDSAILGDELVSGSWEMPPVGLKGLLTLPGGSLAGFDGKQVYFSEPYQPHAFPPEYAMRTDFPVVAIGAYGNNVVVGTTGNPYVISGQEPGQMIADKGQVPYPCLSKRSMVSLGNAAGYATTMGFVSIGDSGTDIVTKEAFSEEAWSKLDPSTVAAEVANGGLYMLSRTELNRIYILDFLNQTGLTDAQIDVYDVYTNPATGKLYVSGYSGSDAVIFEMPDDNGVYMSMQWRSKQFTLPAPLNLGAVRIMFESRFTVAQYQAMVEAYEAAVAANEALLLAGAIGGELNAEEINGETVNGDSLTPVTNPDLESPGITFVLYVDGEAKFTKYVTDTKAFRLPAGYLADNFGVGLSGQVLVQSVQIAETMIGLKDV